MDKTQLVEQVDLQAGREIIEHLERLGIPIDVALWLQDEERGTWRLVLSSPSVSTSGAKPVYEALASILQSLSPLRLELDDIHVAGPNDNLIKDLKRRVGTNDGLHDIRLGSLDLGWTPYRSARVYRVAGGKVEYGARVRVKATGQIGTVYGHEPTPGGLRYRVLYHQDGTAARGKKPRLPSGGTFAAEDLDFLYVVRTGGWPEKTPDWLIAATAPSLLSTYPASGPSAPAHPKNVTATPEG